MKFGTAFIDIKTRFDKRQMAGMQQQIQGTMTGLSGQIGLGVFGGMGAQKAIQALARIRRAALDTGFGIIKAGMDANEAENLFDVSMEHMATEARQWSEQYAESLRLSAFEVREYLGTMQLMLVGMGHTSDSALVLSKRMTQVAFDLSSIKNIPVADAFQKLQAGIAGVIRPLRNMGFALSMAEVKQVGLALGLAETADALSEQNKQVARMILAVHKMRQVHGDLNRTMDEGANRWRAIQTAIVDVRKEIGMQFLPATEDVLSAMNEFSEEGSTWRSMLLDITQGAADTASGFTTMGKAIKDIPIDKVGMISKLLGGSKLPFPSIGELIKGKQAIEELTLSKSVTGPAWYRIARYVGSSARLVGGMRRADEVRDAEQQRLAAEAKELAAQKAADLAHRGGQPAPSGGNIGTALGTSVLGLSPMGGMVMSPTAISVQREPATSALQEQEIKIMAAIAQRLNVTNPQIEALLAGG